MQKTILIVEDEGLIANDMANQLKKGGYHISSIFSSGEDALAVLRESSAPRFNFDGYSLEG